MNNPVIYGGIFLNNISFDFLELYKLQLVLNKIKFHEKKIEKIKNDEELKNHETELNNALKNYDELIEKYNILERERKKLDDELSLKDDKIRRNEQKLASGSITSAKEILSLQEEIESIKKFNSDLENKILEIMIEIDDLNEEIKLEKEKKEKLEAYVNKLKSEINEKVSVEEEKLNSYKDEKERILKEIPEEFINKFNEISEKRNGIAIGILKDRLCLACNMEMSTTEAMKMDSFDEIYRCPNCKRMIIKYREEVDKIIEEYSE